MSQLTTLANPQAEQALLLLHAFPLSSKMWVESGAILAGKLPSLRLLALDVPGFGGTPNEEWSMEEIADRIFAEIADQGLQRLSLCGDSMGGYIALAFYKKCPDVVDALILCDTKAAADSAEARTERESFAEDARKRGSSAAIDRLLPAMLADSNMTLRDPLLTLFTEASGEAIANALRAMKLRSDSTELLPLIGVPTLVIRGAEDAIVSREIMEPLATSIPNAEYREIENAGHLPPFEQPVLFAEAVAKFLKSWVGKYD